MTQKEKAEFIEEIISDMQSAHIKLIILSGTEQSKKAQERIFRIAYNLEQCMDYLQELELSQLAFNSLLYQKKAN